MHEPFQVQLQAKRSNRRTPIDFFLKYKLNKAAELLKSGKYNVSEVGTVSHFSVSFKKQFGVNPSEYK